MIYHDNCHSFSGDMAVIKTCLANCNHGLCWQWGTPGTPKSNDLDPVGQKSPTFTEKPEKVLQSAEKPESFTQQSAETKCCS